MSLTDETTQKVRPPPKGISDLNTRLGVLQRITKVKGCHIKGKMVTLLLSVCSQGELQARKRRVKIKKNISVKV